MKAKLAFIVVVLFLNSVLALFVEASQKKGSKQSSSKAGKTSVPTARVCCDSKALRFLPPASTDVNERLRQASLIACVEEIKALLDKGADVNAKDKRGKTALILASLQGAVSEEGYRRETSPQGVKCRVDTVSLLLEKGADVNAKDQDGGIALMEATFWGRVKVAELLMSKGAEVNAKNQRGETVLIKAVSSPYLSPELVQTLLDKGADVNAKNNEGQTALLAIAEKGNIQVAQMLLAKGANINTKDNYGQTLLMKAVEVATGFQDKNGRLALVNFVEFALANKADLNAKNNKGESVLKLAKQYAEWFQNNTVVELLKKAGAKE
jgi:ankyrin repeat protein